MIISIARVLANKNAEDNDENIGRNPTKEYLI